MLNYNVKLNVNEKIALTNNYKISLNKLANLTDNELKTIAEKYVSTFLKLKRKRRQARRKIKKIQEVEDNKYRIKFDSIYNKIKNFTYEEYIDYIKDLEQYQKSMTIDVWHSLEKEKDNINKLEWAIVDALEELNKPSTIKEIHLKINEKKLFQFTTLNTFVEIGTTLQKYIFDDETNSSIRFYQTGAYYDIKEIDSQYVDFLNQQEIDIALEIDKNPRFFNDALRSEIYLRDKGMCQICGIFVTISNYDCDHLLPFSKGGKTTLENGQCTCRRCNRSKGNSLEEIE